MAPISPYWGAGLREQPAGGLEGNSTGIKEIKGIAISRLALLDSSAGSLYTRNFNHITVFFFRI
jgi:hypothetical protein